MQFTYKDVSLEVPEGRLEVCRLKAKFDTFATEMRDEVMKSFDASFQDMRTFLEKGDEWAHGFIDRGADVVIRELAALDCYDIDRETWIEKYIDYSAWDASTKPYRNMVADLDNEEAEKEARRAERTQDWGNTLSEHKTVVSEDEDGNVEARDSIDGGNVVTNLGFAAASGLFNMIGRGMSKSAIDKRLKEAFESEVFRSGVENGIAASVANAYVAFIDYCMKTGLKTDFIPITKEEIDKANRLLNNIERGLVPAEKVNAMIANAFVANPHSERIYRTLLLKGEDKDGSLTKIADFFRFQKLPNIKKTALLEEYGDPVFTLNPEIARELRELGEQVISNETELAALKDKYATLARNLQVDEAEQRQMLAKIDKDFENAKEEECRRQEEAARKEREQREFDEKLKSKAKTGIRIYLSLPLFVADKLLEKFVVKEPEPLVAQEIPAEASETNLGALRKSIANALHAAGYTVQDKGNECQISRNTQLDNFEGAFAVAPSPTGNGCSLSLTGQTSYSMLLGICSWIGGLLPPGIGFLWTLPLIAGFYVFFLKKRAAKDFRAAAEKARQEVK